ncbi:MAG: 3-oxoacyl-[acyl-carrier-protein] synthase-3 [Bacteroidia bacterium]|jgi:3-oxoacyl-[acyl-carrier-protein] synthase-3
MGKYLPRKIDSSELESKHGIPKGWSLKNSGVQTRHHVTNESGAFMGARALENALDKAGLSPSDLDYIISASATFDYPIPSQASVIKNELKYGGGIDIGTVDVNATCLSFVTAFEMASRMLDGNQYKRIAIVSAEISSKGLDPENWETITLFGDAAVAAIVEYDESGGSFFIKGGSKTYSKGVFDTIIKGGGNEYHIREHPFSHKLHSFQMNGFNLLRLAKKKLPEFTTWFFEGLETTFTEVDVIIPHQGSKLGLSMVNSLYQFKEGQFKDHLADYGNCISASIPLLLHNEIESGNIRRGDSCILIGTSAGFSIGAVLIIY